MHEPSDIQSRALQLGGPGSVPSIVDGDIFKLPHFTADFTSDAFPACNGPVAMRYPSFGDEVEIERLAVIRGGTILARALATLTVCLETAPPCWYRPNPKDGGMPFPAPDRLPCSPDLVALWQQWMIWRDSFRGGVPVPAVPAAE